MNVVGVMPAWVPRGTSLDARHAARNHGRAGADHAALSMTDPPDNPWLEQRRAEAREAGRERANAKVNPADRIRARKAVWRAVRAGLLVARPCEMRLPGCVSSPIEWHHRSYEPGRELDVHAACKPCHDRLSSRAWREVWAAKQRQQGRGQPAERAPGVVTIDEE